MCRMASLIQARDKIYWSKLSDSHDDIIREFNLGHLDADVLHVELVRVEIIPPGDNYALPLCEWEFHTDQDIIPEWYDPYDSEKRARIALEKWAERKIISSVRHVDHGNYVAVGNATVEAWDNATVEAGGNATVINYSKYTKIILEKNSVCINRYTDVVSVSIAEHDAE